MDSIAPIAATPPSVQNAILLPFLASNPTAESFPTTKGPTDRARQDIDADTPFTRTRSSGEGAVFAMLEKLVS